MIAVGARGHYPMWESPSHEKWGTIGGKVHGMTQSGRLEGFAEGFGAEVSGMVCAAREFMSFPFCSLMGSFVREEH